MADMDADAQRTNAAESNREVRRLVFGDDGSIGADLAWLWINSHRWPGWQLEIVTAQGPQLDPVVAAGEVARRQPFREAEFATCLHLQPRQDPRLALSAAADLIVVGPRGPGLLKRLHLGSTAEWLVSRPPAPLVVARHGRRTRRVLLANDCSLDSWAVVDALARLPFIGDAIVDLVVIGGASSNGDRVARDTFVRLGRPAAGGQVIHVDDVDRVVDVAEAQMPDLIAVAGGEHRDNIVETSAAGRLLRHLEASMLIGSARHAPARVDQRPDEDGRPYRPAAEIGTMEP